MYEQSQSASSECPTVDYVPLCHYLEHFTKHDVIVVLIVFGGVELIARFVAGKLLDMGYYLYNSGKH
jgi:hypothetical protein